MGEEFSCNGFWGRVAAREHLVEFYEDEGRFMDTLERFVLEGLRGGEAVLAIADRAYLGAVRARLEAAGLDSATLEARGCYVPLDAASTLSQIMAAGWPDEARFEGVIGAAIAQARLHARPVRAFSQMVGLLWAQGRFEATVRLEELWHRLCHRQEIAVLCGYPRIGSTRDLHEAVAEVCALHSQVRGAAGELRIAMDA